MSAFRLRITAGDPRDADTVIRSGGDRTGNVGSVVKVAGEVDPGALGVIISVAILNNKFKKNATTYINKTVQIVVDAIRTNLPGIPP